MPQVPFIGTKCIFFSLHSCSLNICRSHSWISCRNSKVSAFSINGLKAIFLYKLLPAHKSILNDFILFQRIILLLSEQDMSMQVNVARFLNILTIITKYALISFILDNLCTKCSFCSYFINAFFKTAFGKP